ncbi:MAG: electron transfer flavoprotein subunit beta/FixA family protein [Chloroflexota bacterium]|nr:electron transfer flavoprotein subunit beta/FixA family protein [Chloroflexota bacterium]
MHIVVLLKAVPIVGNERLDDGYRIQRTQLEANGNDEYVLEKALKLTETAGGEVSLLSMGPAGAVDAIRKALAMGATRAYHVQDEALAGACLRQTIDVLTAAVQKLEFDLLFCGADTSDGQGGVVAPALAARLGLPYLSYASEIEPGEGTVRVHRLSPTGYDALESATPALVMGTQVLGEPRYPSLRGIMQARSKEVTLWSLADLAIDPASVGGDAATTKVLSKEAPPQRSGATILKGAPEEVVAQTVDFLAQRRLI